MGPAPPWPLSAPAALFVSGTGSSEAPETRGRGASAGEGVALRVDIAPRWLAAPPLNLTIGRHA